MDENKGFRRQIGCERPLLMLPFNVVMVAKIKGSIDIHQLKKVLGSMKQRHRLLSIRVTFNEEKDAFLTDESVPEFTLKMIERENRHHWIDLAEREFADDFPIKTGPLVRFTLVHAENVSELIVCGHHLICDGLSLTYLIRDILSSLNSENQKTKILPDPPPVNNHTAPSPPKISPLVRKVINIFNKKWGEKGIQFSEEDRKRLHSTFWEKQKNIKLLAWRAPDGVLGLLQTKCREKSVTVNSAIWTAFLSAQHDIQKKLKSYHHKAALAVNTRDKLLVPVGEAFGFYASSLKVKLKYAPKKEFWKNTESIHKKIKERLETTNLFRMLTATLFNPTLIDALYFRKYDLIDHGLVKQLLKKMEWDKISYGYAITNVGKVDIPTTFGPLTLEAIYGPSIYSDVQEKIVGAITIGSTLTFMMTYNEDIIPTDMAMKLKDGAMNHLLLATGLG